MALCSHGAQSPSLSDSLITPRQSEAATASELEGRGELEQIALDALFISELRNKPRVQIEQALSNLRRVGNDRAHTESATAAATSVGSMSSCAKTSLLIVPGLITPGQRMAHGTRYPPSQFVFFSPRKGEVPPSGHVNFSAPLSVAYMTI